jgi:ribosomal protein S18 acetylase RimI-like enzyme
MTQSTAYISQAQQKLWFRDNRHNLLFWLAAFGSVTNAGGTDRVTGRVRSPPSEEALELYSAYGGIRLVNNKFMLSGGVAPELRGVGQGEAIFSFLISKCKELSAERNLAEITESSDIFLEVYRDNLPAYNLYRKLGFSEFGIRGNILVMALASNVKKIRI